MTADSISVSRMPVARAEAYDAAGGVGASAAGGCDAAAAAARVLLRGAGAFFPPCTAALRSALRRFKRAFLAAWPLRRLIFIELRLSCFPTARKMHL
jgi:hypothetical protein